MILGWDWISSHDLRFLYPPSQGGVVGGGPHGEISPPSSRHPYGRRPSRSAEPPATHAAVRIGHKEF